MVSSIVVESCDVRNPTSNSFRHCEEQSDEAIHSFFLWRDGLLRGACHRARVRATRRLATTVKRCLSSLLPGEYRLFQFRHAGIASRHHFAELIDQGGGRRVDEPAGVTKPDHAPRALGDSGEVE